MKKLSQILENNTEVTGLQAKPLLIDNTGLVLSYLEQISEMADEIYNTLSDLPEIDREVHTLIQNVYTNLDDAYEIVDNKYEIKPIDDLDEIEESFENELSEESKTVELVYKDLAKMNNTALRGILRRMNHPDFNDIKDQRKEDLISEILMFKFGEEKALKFLENPNNFKMSESVKSPQQKFDMKRVNSGAMSRDEYNKKYKLGKYTPPQQKFDMKRVNSGAMSRDEYNKKYKLASAASKSESIESEIFEEVDISRLKQLALTGLVSKEDTPKLVSAMRTLENNKQLSVAQRDIIIGTFLSLIGIVTGDSALFNKVKQSV